MFGCLSSSPIPWDNPVYSFISNPIPLYKTGVVGGGSQGCGSKTYLLPPVYNKSVLDGCTAGRYTEDLYNRIIVSPTAVSLGGVLSVKQVVVSVWNAWSHTMTLATIDEANVDGITYDGGSMPPSAYPGLSAAEYTFTVSNRGAPAIDATFTFNFTTEEVALQITGTRVYLFPFHADWSSKITEKLDWLTDVIESYNGTEQAILLRDKPRRVMEVSVGAFYGQLQLLKSLLSQNQSIPYAIPLWPYVTNLTAVTVPGSTRVYVDTVNREFKVGGFIALLAQGEQHEVREIAGIAATYVDVTSPLSTAWPVGLPTYPTELAMISSSQSITQLNSDLVTTRVTFEMLEPYDMPDSYSPGSTYLGNPVLLDLPDWANSRTRGFARKMAIVDGNTGAKFWDEESVSTRMSDTFSWFLNGRDRIRYFRDWLSSRKGRQGYFWLPSWMKDVTVVEEITPVDTSIVVEGNWYSSFYKNDPNRHLHFIIQTFNKGTFYRKVTGIYQVDDTKDAIELDAIFGVTIYPEDIQIISSMTLMRLGSDAFEVSWTHPTFATCEMETKSVSV